MLFAVFVFMILSRVCGVLFRLSAFNACFCAYFKENHFFSKKTCMLLYCGYICIIKRIKNAKHLLCQV